MNVVFSNGTDRQQALTRAAIEFCTFDFTRLDTTITFSFVGQDELDLNPDDNFIVFANTTLDAGANDGCGRPGVAAIKVWSQLDDNSRSGQFVGEKFFMETVIHEIGHVLAGKFSQPQVTTICAAFGGTLDQWQAEGASWYDRISEAWAESFKDAYLPRDYRQFDDRTKWRLRDTEDSYYAALRILDDICPCAGIVAT